MRRLRALWLRLMGSLGAKSAGGDFDAELESHVAMHTADGVRAGLSRDEARRQALLRLGGEEQTRQRRREGERIKWMENFWRDVRFGVRILRKSPGFTLIAVLTLALGIGATTAIYSVVKAVMLAPLPYRDASRIVQVWTTKAGRGGDINPSSPGDFAEWKRSGVFEDLAPSYDFEVTLSGQGEPQFFIGYAVSASYLRILGVQPQMGRIYTDSEDQPKGPKVVVLGDPVWRTTFHSDPGIVGRAITLDGDAYTVLGVMPRGFEYPQGVALWLPAQMAAGDYNDFKRTYVRALGRLRSGISIGQAESTLNKVEAQLAVAHPESDSGNRVVVQSLREQLDGDIRKPLLVLMCAVAFVLLIACANTAGLELARNTERQREIAVRLALGATRGRILRQFVTENLLLTLIGGAAGLGLAAIGARSLLTLFPNDVANVSIPKVTEIPIDGGVLAFALGITAVTAILFAVAPVLKATRTEADAAMSDAARQTTGSRRGGVSQSVLVVAEISLSLVLLTTAGLFVASFRKVVESNLGFQPDHMLSIQVLLPPNRYPFKEQTKTRLFVQATVEQMKALPGVKSAGATNFLPLSGFWGTTNFLLRGQPAPKNLDDQLADDRAITPEYLSTMGIPLLRGRGFTSADRNGGAKVALINETFAKAHFKASDPIGQELNLGSVEKPEWWQIVGVTGDVKAFGQDKPTHFDVYRPFDQNPYPLIAFTLRTAEDPASMLKSAEKAMWSVDPELPVFKAMTMEDYTSQSLAVRRASSAIIGCFAALALVLACIGIYGTMAYAVSRRTREIGVRMALGARRGDVLRMVMGSGLRMAAIGIAIGLTGALAASRLIGSLLFEMSAIDPKVFAGAAVALAASAALASLVPARRAAGVEPMRALRTE